MRACRTIGIVGSLLALIGCAGVDRRVASESLPPRTVAPTTVSRPSADRAADASGRAGDRVSRYFPLFNRPGGDSGAPGRRGPGAPRGAAPGRDDSATVGDVPPPPLVRSTAPEPSQTLPPLLPVTLEIRVPSQSDDTGAERLAARPLPALKAVALRPAERDEVVTTSAEETDPPSLPPLAHAEAADDMPSEPVALPPVIEARPESAPIALEEDASRLAAKPQPRPVKIVHPAAPAGRERVADETRGTRDAAAAPVAAAQPPVTTPAPEPDLVPPPAPRGAAGSVPAASAINAPGSDLAPPPPPVSGREPSGAAEAAPMPAAPSPNPESAPVFVSEAESEPIPTVASYQAEPMVSYPPVPSKQCPPCGPKPCFLKAWKKKCCQCLKQKCAAWKAHCPLKCLKQKCAAWKKSCCIFKKCSPCASPQCLPSSQSVPVPSMQSAPVPSGQYSTEQWAPAASDQGYGLFSWRKSSRPRSGLLARLRPSRPEVQFPAPAGSPEPSLAPRALPPEAPAPAQLAGPSSPRGTVASQTRVAPRAPAPPRAPASTTYIPYGSSNMATGDGPVSAPRASAPVAARPRRAPLLSRLARRIRGDRGQESAAPEALAAGGGRSARREADDLAKSRDDLQRVSADRIDEAPQR